MEVQGVKILVVEPEKKPYSREISDDVHGMQEVVRGLIEPIRFEPKNDAIAFCNEEFLFNGSRPNRQVGGVMVHRTFFVVGNVFNEYGEEISVSLTDEQIEKYSEKFESPMYVLPEGLCGILREIGIFDDDEDSDEVPEMSM